MTDTKLHKTRYNDVDDILKKNLIQIFASQVNTIKIAKAGLEILDNFDYDIILDYLEMSGIPWITKFGKLNRLPTKEEIRSFLLEELNTVIKDKIVVEKHLLNNFLLFYNGDHITLTYNIVSMIRGSKIKKI
jgi:hypothetical protein